METTKNLETVEFIRPANTGLVIYGAGERAGFEPAMVAHLVNAGFARRLSPQERDALKVAARARQEERAAARASSGTRAPEVGR